MKVMQTFSEFTVQTNFQKAVLQSKCQAKRAAMKKKKDEVEKPKKPPQAPKKIIVRNPDGSPTKEVLFRD